ncbi:MAG: hypothetical protein R6X25_13645 [Candidatus Krumholzibacteriia bacterium]
MGSSLGASFRGFPPSGWIVVLLAALLLATGCDEDDPTEPGPSPSVWQEVELDHLPASVAVLDIAFEADRGLALGVAAEPRTQPPSVTMTSRQAQTGPALLLEQGADGTWTQAGADAPPAWGWVMELALGLTGEAVFVGFDRDGMSATARIEDRRPASPTVFSGSGALTTIDADGTFMVAGGLFPRGILWSSTAPGSWQEDDPPLTGSGESGFWDVDVRGDRAVACGFDDGADTLRVLVQRTRTGPWQKVDLAGSGTFGVSFRSVAVDDAGAIYVGGTLGAGGLDARAYLALRSAGGEWTEVALPDAQGLGRVNDILLAEDGSIYLACSGELEDATATVVHGSPSAVEREVTPFPGELFQLAQSPDGTVYAVGLRREEPGGEERGIILRRPG